uniref:Uncharacterized protein n=1 Tax=Cannabis sativa TaxID=3483 RepID=A0A803R544_CANSA
MKASDQSLMSAFMVQYRQKMLLVQHFVHSMSKTFTQQISPHFLTNSMVLPSDQAITVPSPCIGI